MLLAAGADVKYRSSACDGQSDNCSALDVAVSTGEFPSARLLVEAGADLSPPSFSEGKANDLSPLLKVAASSSGPSELFELMLEKGANPNYASTKCSGQDFNYAALQWTLHAARIRVLCEWGADVNAVSRTDSRRTPLHVAAARRTASSAPVSALVVAGADPFEVDAEGYAVTPNSSES